jgi:hypothetical protein
MNMSPFLGIEALARGTVASRRGVGVVRSTSDRGHPPPQSEAGRPNFSNSEVSRNATT